MSKHMQGIVGIWSDEEKLKAAARKTVEAGFEKFEAITPFPVHGLDEACGLKRSWIPWVTFVFAAVGLFCGWYFQYYVAAVNWPIIIGGKPFHSLPAFIPVMFELTILFSALSSVAVCLFVICRLPKVNPPIIDPDLTCSKFAIFIPENDNGFETSKVEALLKDAGAEEVRSAEF